MSWKLSRTVLRGGATGNGGSLLGKQEGKVKLPWYIRLKDGSPMVFAGLWETWKSPEGEVNSFTILTTASNRLVEPLHDRMPVILRPDDYRLWLYRKTTNPAGLVHLFQSYPADLMEMYPVSPLVNSVRNESANLTEPVSDDPILDIGCPNVRKKSEIDDIR